MMEQYHPEVCKALSYIEQHYTDPLTLDEVCRYSQLSKSYFCYFFKEQTSQTFVEYLNKRRIDHARLLLEDTDLPVTEICYNTGFNDLTHFSRTFKKITGISARAYRSQKREK